eukprot:TRINITY_DN49_c0_g5_i1.p1 TRINITY_DN49_c0_g5~~TRINITY_DN49_c0_g5_i1.p1  ORF type:complete len:433 (+),score=158.36 TRINITY_DN49_c0_g5_i1:72-1301(+)
MAAVAVLLPWAAAAAIGGQCSHSSCTWNNHDPFNIAQAQRAIHLSAAAYCTPENVDTWNCGDNCNNAPGMQDITVFTATCPSVVACHLVLLGYVGWDSTKQAVAAVFRGTDNLPNWVSNLDTVYYSPYGDYNTHGYVHKGFHQAWLGLKNEGMWAAVQSLLAEHPGAAVYSVGHSLGGAMATLAARDFATDMVVNGATPAVHLYTLGSPRVGDKVFGYNLHSALAASWRMTHNKDIVPHVPLRAMGFDHVGREVHFHSASGSDYEVCDGSGEDSSCANSCWWLVEPGLCTSILDHGNYAGISVGFGTGCDGTITGGLGVSFAAKKEGGEEDGGAMGAVKEHKTLFAGLGAGLLALCGGVALVAAHRRRQNRAQQPRAIPDEAAAPAAEWKEMKDGGAKAKAPEEENFHV